MDSPSQTKTIVAPVTLVQTAVISRREMDPGELHAPRHITHCHRSALLLPPLRMRQGSGHRAAVCPGWPEGRSPIAAGVMCLPRHSGCPCGWGHHRTRWHSARGQGQLPTQGLATGTHFCVPAVPFPGPFPALPSPEGKHSWHICHVRLNTASFTEEKNQIKENPVLPLLPLVFFYI